MIGYILTQEQYDQVQGQEYAPYQCFNCVQDINDIWFTFLTGQDREVFKDTEYIWLFDLPQGEYIPKQHQTF